MSDEHKIPFFDDYGVTDGNLRKAYDQLELYVCAGRPLIYIQSFDFAVVDSMVARIADRVPDRKMEIVEYVDGLGCVKFHGKAEDDDFKKFNSLKTLLLHYVNSVGRWDRLEKPPKKIILLLKNIHKELEKDNEIQSLLRQLALVSMRENGDTETKTFVYAIIVSPQLFIPMPLERLMALVRVEAPTEFEIKEHVERTLEHLTPPIMLNNDAYERITSALLGLSRVEIDQVLALVLADNKRLESREGQAVILAEKRQLIQKSGLLKIVKDERDEEEIGGLDKLQEYLRNEAKIYDQLEIAENLHVGIPKGVLIVGMPGCGKTMTAKMAAKWFHAPLICLDIGRLMGPYVGQSEENLRRALSMVESVAPCILWIDELEKAFSGVVSGKGGGSEVTTRLFGHFLTWMQEKRGGVYVIATANRINLLPPELLRRGRFDEVFRVDFPSEKEQEAIFTAQLKRRLLNETFDVSKFTKKGFCGADIATIVGNAFKKAFLGMDKSWGGKFNRDKRDQKNIEFIHDDIQQALEKEAEEMIPLQEVLKDDISEIVKVLNKYQFKPASSMQGKDDMALDGLGGEMEKAKLKLEEATKTLAYLTEQIETKKSEMEKDKASNMEQTETVKGKDKTVNGNRK